MELDREKTAQKIRNDLKEEKTELKKILNEELGLFKRDESVNQENQARGAEEIFRFEFSDEPDSANLSGKGQGKTKVEKESVKKGYHSE